MLLTLTTTRPPATDLGWLLHKHPDRVQEFDLPYGKAHVFYTAAREDSCTAVLIMDIDPIGLIRNRRGPAGEGFVLQQYVNDRPYVASSFMSVAIGRVFGSALSGRCANRPELPDEVLPLEAQISVLPCHGGEEFLRKLFEPLGYEISVQTFMLDSDFPDWGQSKSMTVKLRANCRLQDLLTHLYVLIPVLDNEKHYWVGEDELEKLLRKGEGWLADHPERQAITNRYLKFRRSLARVAMSRLTDDDHPNPDEEDDLHKMEEEAVEATIATENEGAEPQSSDTADLADSLTDDDDRGPSLHSQRLATVQGALRSEHAKSVVDLGCGEGKLLRRLLNDSQFDRIVGMDVSIRSLKIASERLKLDRLPPLKRKKIDLIHGSLMYRDDRLAGFDAAACVEVIEHLDQPRLAAFERCVFEFARPRTVVITTPNCEYNVLFESLPAGQLRHRDHRFEWTRNEFESWSTDIASRFQYNVRFLPVGPVDAEFGAPTQMAIFTL